MTPLDELRDAAARCEAALERIGADRLLLRRATAAHVLDMPLETLRALERRGDLRGVRVGRALYFARVDLEEFVARHREPSSARAVARRKDAPGAA